MFSCICRPAFWPETYFPLLFILFYFPLFYSLRRRTSLGPTHHDNINAGNSKTCLPRQATIIFFWSMYRNYEIHVCIYKYGHSTLSMETWNYISRINQSGDQKRSLCRYIVCIFSWTITFSIQSSYQNHFYKIVIIFCEPPKHYTFVISVLDSELLWNELLLKMTCFI